MKAYVAYDKKEKTLRVILCEVLPRELSNRGWHTDDLFDAEFNSAPLPNTLCEVVVKGWSTELMATVGKNG